MSHAAIFMIACLDVDYRENVAQAAGLLFREWPDSQATLEKVIQVENIQPYQPGEFYRRELPCLLQVLAALPAVNLVIIDGYVWLDGPGKPGLGAHLYQALGEKTPVIGVAKTAFRDAHGACEILRGESTRPLFISAVGMDLSEAADHIRAMHGPNRIPTLLKEVDRLARSRKAEPPNKG